MRKGNDGAQVITVLSNQGSSGSEYTLSLEKTGFSSGKKVTEVYTCTELTVDSDGKVPVPMNKGSPRVLFPTEKLSGSKLCSGSN